MSSAGKEARTTHPGRARPGFNTVVAVGCILFSIFLFLVIPSQIERPPMLFGQSATPLDPALFPQLVAGGFLLVGLWYLWESFRMAETNALRALDREAYRNIACTLGAFFVYAMLLVPTGFIIASAILIGALSCFYGARHLPSIVITALGVPTVVYLLFTRVLKVSLPGLPEF